MLFDSKLRATNPLCRWSWQQINYCESKYDIESEKFNYSLDAVNLLLSILLHTTYEVDENEYRKEQPYNRVTFYYSGEKSRTYLAQGEKELFFNVEQLFERIFEFAQRE